MFGITTKFVNLKAVAKDCHDQLVPPITAPISQQTLIANVAIGFTIAVTTTGES
jgi:hypothetical protein